MLDKKYIILESIGNFSDIVFTSDNFNECQDYLQERYQKAIDARDINDSETNMQLFYSYFSIQEYICEY